MQERVECPLAGVLAQRIRDARDEMTRRWLDRIAARVTIEPDHIFPTGEMLDHVPLLMDGIADYMENPADEISADVPVIAKAMELGELRFSQGFSAHEILKEYEILGGVLFSFLVHTVSTVSEDCSRSELLACAQRLFRAVAVIQQVTTTHYLRVVDEEVREREERLRSFNRMVTHELKNRISAVRGASSMLHEPWVEGDVERQEQFLSVIDRNVEGMQAVLQDLLTLSRTDGSARQQRHVLLPEAIAEAARQLREMAEERGVEVRIADDLPRVEVDAGAVELCLVNYISNGIKYSDPEKTERWVKVRAHLEESDGEVVIEVQDNGVGIPVDAREHLFKPFYRGETVGEVEGTGLGLSIVRETVEGLGGRAWTEAGDRENEGSTFKIALPARRETDAGTSRPEEAGKSRS